MAGGRADGGIAQMFRALHAWDADRHTDGQLLGLFLARRDEAAFAALVRRHGPMALGVCYRILGNAADAEDAFQATFLVLARKADSLATRVVLGDWLHGVARRTALNARRLATRRRMMEQSAARPESHSEDVQDERLALLDEALARLPEKYRLPLVLCDLEGRTRAEAARRLGWPEGTVAGRLARGRALLSRRLAARGLSPTSFAPRVVPTALASAAVWAATAGTSSAEIAILTEGVLKAMFLTKLKVAATALLATAILGAGTVAGVHNYRAHGQEPPAKQASDRKDAAKVRTTEPPAPDKADRIRPGDSLFIHATGTIPNAPVRGTFLVEPGGKVALGPVYGRVEVQGLTLEEAEAAIHKQLSNILKSTAVSVTRSVAVPGVEELERRVRQLENDVRTLRSEVEQLRKKSRD